MSRTTLDHLGGKPPSEMTLSEQVEIILGDKLDHAGITLAKVTAEDVISVGYAWAVETVLTAAHHAELLIGRPFGRIVGRVLEAVI